MDLPFYILFFSEQIGKPVSAFTKADWKQAAMGAAALIDKWCDQINPPPKRRGRPRKTRTPPTALKPGENALMRALLLPKPKGRGAPKKDYGGLSAADILKILEDLKHKFPKKKRDHLRAILSRLQENDGVQHDLTAVERAVRHEEEKRQNKNKW